jgi:hypothetical protein
VSTGVVVTGVAVTVVTAVAAAVTVAARVIVDVTICVEVELVGAAVTVLGSDDTTLQFLKPPPAYVSTIRFSVAAASEHEVGSYRYPPKAQPMSSA